MQRVKRKLMKKSYYFEKESTPMSLLLELMKKTNRYKMKIADNILPAIIEKA